MKNIRDSIIATNGGQISNIRIKKKNYFSIENKKSFWSGFFLGIISSLMASGIWFLIQKLWIE